MLGDHTDLPATDTTGDVTAWPTTTATAERPTVDRRHYIGHHRAGKHRNPRTGRHEIDQPVAADWTPLAGATRTGLAPHHYAQADVYVPASGDELTGRLDTTAVCADPTPAPTDRTAVMAEIRAALTPADQIGADQ